MLMLSGCLWEIQLNQQEKKKVIILHQRVKKVMSDSLGLVDFVIGLVIFALNLPEGQVLFSGEIQITEGL